MDSRVGRRSFLGVAGGALALTGLPAVPAEAAERLDPDQGNSGGQLVPDTIYVNGTVITMDGQERITEAFAILGDKFVAVGRNGDIRRLAGRGTKVVDLRGKTVIPGFVDAHSHFPGSGTAKLFNADLSGPPVGTVSNIADLVAALQAKAGSTPAGQWVRGSGYDQTLLAEQRHPTRQDLDRASTTHPIWAGHANGHMGVANSKAMEIAGITKDTPDPPGGVIVRDPQTGEPAGLLEETAQRLVSSHIPGLTPQQLIEGVKETIKIYAAVGVTTSVIAGGGRQNLLNLQTWRKDNLLPIRFSMMQSGDPTPGEAGGMLPGFGDEWVEVGPYGEVPYDGSIQGYTGYLSKPYHKIPPELPKDFRGYTAYTREQLLSRVKELYAAGFTLAIHGNGDAAIDDILDAYEEAQRESGVRDARFRVEHAQMARPDQLQRMKRMGVSPSFFVSHTFYWGDQHRDIFMGPERAARISPLKSAGALGLRYSIHLDSPVVPMSPLQAVWSAVNRITRSGEVLGPDERVSPMRALRAVTIDAAWQNFQESEKGSIEKGKLADFVVLDANPLRIQPTKIKDIKVLETITGGSLIYHS